MVCHNAQTGHGFHFFLSRLEGCFRCGRIFSKGWRDGVDVVDTYLMFRG